MVTLRDKIENKFIKFCFDNQYFFQKDYSDKNKVRIDVTDCIEKTIINIYNTGTVLIQGKDNYLKNRFDKLIRRQ